MEYMMPADRYELLATTMYSGLPTNTRIMTPKHFSSVAHDAVLRQRMIEIFMLTEFGSRLCSALIPPDRLTSDIISNHDKSPNTPYPERNSYTYPPDVAIIILDSLDQELRTLAPDFGHMYLKGDDWFSKAAAHLMATFPNAILGESWSTGQAPGGSINLLGAIHLDLLASCSLAFRFVVAKKFGIAKQGRIMNQTRLSQWGRDYASERLTAQMHNAMKTFAAGMIQNILLEYKSEYQWYLSQLRCLRDTSNVQETNAIHQQLFEIEAQIPIHLVY